MDVGAGCPWAWRSPFPTAADAPHRGYPHGMSCASSARLAAKRYLKNSRDRRSHGGMIPRATSRSDSKRTPTGGAGFRPASRRCTSGCSSRTSPTRRSTSRSSSCSSGCSRTSSSSPSSPSSRAASPSSSTRSSSPTSASGCCRRRPGRTTMCPTELLYDPSRPPSIRLLPIETRLNDATVTEFKNYADEWVHVPARPRRGRAHGRGARARVAGEARAGRARAQVRPVQRARRGHPVACSRGATRAASTSRAGATR